MADAPADPAAGYYTGRPLNYDPQQAQAVPAPAPQAEPQPQPAAGEQANARPAAQTPPPQNAGDQANHTHVHGVPGYYKGRVNQSPASAPPPPDAPRPAVKPEKELSCIDKLLMCFTGGKNTK